MKYDLKPLLKPKSIAIVGAAGDPSKRPGGRPLLYLKNQGYKGKIFPINPNYDSILGFKSYPDLKSVPDEIDVALILRPAKYTLDVLKECEEKGVKAAIVPAAGFAETGEGGRQSQEVINEIAKRSNMAVLGPNCQGMINIPDKAIASFSVVAEMELISGELAFVSQSGAMGSSVFGACIENGIGFKYYISTGNEACLESLDFMEFLVEDSGTKVIASYIEGFKNAKRLSEIADLALSNKKPIVILKTGTTPDGAKAAASHTAALAGSDLVYDAVFRQKGILRANDIDEMFNMARLLVKGKIPEGNRLAVFGRSGGAGVLIADYCYQMGLQLIELKDETKDQLRKILPPFCSVSNPVDAGGSTDEAFINSLKAMIEYEKVVDIIIVSQPIGIIGDEALRVAQGIVDVSRETQKLVVVLWMGAKFTEPAYKIIEDNDLPLFKTPLSCMQAVKGAVEYGTYLRRFQNLKTVKTERPAQTKIDEVACFLKSIGRKTLTEHEGKGLLSKYDISVTREEIATSPTQAIEIAKKLGYPVTLKLQSPQIVHKTEAKIVRLDIKTEEELRKAYEDILDNAKKHDPKAEIQGILVQEMLPPAYEVIVGLSKDSQFGLTIMFGLGGIFVELLKDFSLRIAPLSREDAEEMIREIKGFKMLEGYRGRGKADLNGIIDVLLKVSQLATDFKDLISEIDINPLFVFEDGRGVKAADTLVILQ